MSRQSVLLGSATIIISIAAIYFWKEIQKERNLRVVEQASMQPIESGLGPSPQPPQQPPPQPGTQAPLQVVAPKVSSAPTAPAVSDPQPGESMSAAESKLVEDVSVYVRTFKPGVYKEEQIPQFAADFFLSSNDMAVRELATNAKYEQEPMDEWALDMERRLREYFERQPEISNVRLSVGCRVSQCQVQLVELHSGARVSGALGARLYNEAWFKGHFKGVGSGGFTPNLGAAHYTRIVVTRPPKKN